MITLNRRLALSILTIIILNLACGTSAPTEAPDSVLATQVQMTMAELESRLSQQPSGTDEALLPQSPRLLLLDGKNLFSMDALTMETEPLLVLGSIPEQNAFFELESMSISYRDENALHVLDLQNGEERLVMADQRSEKEIIRFVPMAWVDSESILVQRYHYILDDSESWSYTNQIGWLTISTGVWQPLPTLEDIHIPMDCSADIALSPDGQQAALALNSHGSDCGPLVPGLHIIDLKDTVIQTIISRQGESTTTHNRGAFRPSWSDDGGWIAVSLYDVATPSDESTQFAGRLYLLRPNGADLTLLTDNASGLATSPIWGRSGRLYYGIVHSGDGSDGIFIYDPFSQSTTTVVESTAAPSGISPDETILVYRDDLGISHNLKLNYLPRGESYDIPAPSGEPLRRVTFLGWTP